MKSLHFLLTAVALAAVVSSGVAAPAPVSVENKAAARAEFAKARALSSSDITGAVAGMRKAIELDPDYCEGHQYFILYSGMAASGAPGALILPSNAAVPSDEEKKAAEKRTSEKKAAGEKARAATLALYEQWAKEQPDRAAYQYALGIQFEYADPDRALRHFEAAVKLDPKCGDAYGALATCAEVRGKLEQSREYLRLAVEADPDNATSWRHYIAEYREADIDKGIALGLEMAKKFPDEAASVLGYLATRQRNEAKAREIYELLHAKFPKAAARNLTSLFSIYLKSDRAKALALAQEMAALVPENKEWPVLVDYAKALIDSDAFIAAGKPAEALAALGKITLPRYGADRRWLHLERAQATAASGQTEKAYADLLALMIKTPTDEYQAALTGYGEKLGRNAAQVTAEVMTQRAAAAKPGVPFSLVNYYTAKRVALDDYKGRVVLVNFWYPMCGPCRGEFPFLQAALEKYRDQGFEILAINGNAPEDHMVLPLLKGWKLDFLPLKSDGAVVKNYKVRGFPSNFLYGPDGKIYYEPPPVNGLGAQRELEMQIEALLAQAKLTPKT
ncbi:MAG: redoxin protein [Verrucomicrobia bacterium]|nr:redoxin protein [Verrucomicrobiota bacterium]